MVAHVGGHGDAMEHLGCEVTLVLALNGLGIRGVDLVAQGDHEVGLGEGGHHGIERVGPALGVARGVAGGADLRVAGKHEAEGLAVAEVAGLKAVGGRPVGAVAHAVDVGSVGGEVAYGGLVGAPALALAAALLGLDVGHKVRVRGERGAAGPALGHEGHLDIAVKVRRAHPVEVALGRCGADLQGDAVKLHAALVLNLDLGGGLSLGGTRRSSGGNRHNAQHEHQGAQRSQPPLPYLHATPLFVGTPRQGRRRVRRERYRGALDAFQKRARKRAVREFYANVSSPGGASRSRDFCGLKSSSGSDVFPVGRKTHVTFAASKVMRGEKGANSAHKTAPGAMPGAAVYAISSARRTYASA